MACMAARRLTAVVNGGEKRFSGGVLFGRGCFLDAFRVLRFLARCWRVGWARHQALVALPQKLAEAFSSSYDQRLQTCDRLVYLCLVTEVTGALHLGARRFGSTSLPLPITRGDLYVCSRTHSE